MLWDYCSLPVRLLSGHYLLQLCRPSCTLSLCTHRQLMILNLRSTLFPGRCNPEILPAHNASWHVGHTVARGLAEERRGWWRREQESGEDWMGAKKRGDEGRREERGWKRWKRSCGLMISSSPALLPPGGTHQFGERCEWDRQARGSHNTPPIGLLQPFASPSLLLKTDSCTVIWELWRTVWEKF